MDHQSSLEHFQTYARLHRGDASELEAIQAFCKRAPLSLDDRPRDWKQTLVRDDTYILVATECHLIVGVGVLRHVAGSPEASLDGLFLGSKIGTRGVDQLIVHTLVGRARSEGAAVLHVQNIGKPNTIDWVLIQAGFTEQSAGLWTFGLWNGHTSRSYSDIVIPEHEPVSLDESLAQSLLIAMGALDNSMLLTARARQVLSHEVAGDAKELTVAVAIGLAAARRGYFVRLQASVAETALGQGMPDVAERISSDPQTATPESVLGHLSRGRICMLHADLPRFHDAPHWYLITGFDGFLFSLHDVACRANSLQPMAVTTFELREALSNSGSVDFVVLGKVL